MTDPRGLPGGSQLKAVPLGDEGINRVADAFIGRLAGSKSVALPMTLGGHQLKVKETDNERTER